MRVELDQAFFKRLVWLSVFVGLSSLFAMAPQFLPGRWFEFSLAFDRLVEQRFELPIWNPAAEIAIWVALGGVFIWMMVSVVGLLWFQRWARLGFWLGPLVGFALLALAEGFRPTFTSPLDDLLGFIDSAIFGAIVLLSYAKGYGAEWFVPAAAIKEG